jgi:hypothetical protein
MSNNFDGPIILDSTFNNATEPGYLGTGGRTGEASVGPRLSGGTAAELAAAGNAPAGSLYLQSDDASLLQQTTIPTGNTWSPVSIGGGGAVVGGLRVTIPAGAPAPVLVGVNGAQVGPDLVQISCSALDTTTGATPASGRVTAPDVVTIVIDPVWVGLTANPTGDGEWDVLVVRV